MDAAGRGAGAGGGVALRSPVSPSSLELTLESKKLEEAQKDYLSPLTSIVQDKPDVIGYAAAINGKMNAAEMYGSHALFIKTWPLLLKATVIEAIAERPKAKSAKPVSSEAALAFLAALEAGKASEKAVNARLALIEHQSPTGVLFETRDREGKDS